LRKPILRRGNGKRHASPTNIAKEGGPGYEGGQRASAVRPCKGLRLRVSLSKALSSPGSASCFLLLPRRQGKPPNTSMHPKRAFAGNAPQARLQQSCMASKIPDFKGALHAMIDIGPNGKLPRRSGAHATRGRAEPTEATAQPPRTASLADSRPGRQHVRHVMRSCSSS
jgi:hypothetical protein